MQDEATLIKNRKKMIVALLVLIFVIASCLFIMNGLSRRNIIENLNSTDLNTLSQKELNEINQSLKIMLKSNYGLDDDALNKVKAVVRENSMKIEQDEKTKKVTAAQFLMDINDPKLTYEVSFDSRLSDTTFKCPELGLMQDANVFCIGSDKQSTIDVALGKYLPFRAKTESGTYFSIWRDYDDNNSPRLEMYASICGDEEKGKEVLSTIKGWIKEKGVNPDSIPINYQSSYCDHGSDD
ncbi:hypothetical protein J6X15_01795 [Candidatus Saccharibacteria bacterium]|nr:hypothetical protein [Candidatus Saccharibacteria bacterium]